MTDLRSDKSLIAKTIEGALTDPPHRPLDSAKNEAVSSDPSSTVSSNGMYFALLATLLHEAFTRANQTVTMATENARFDAKAVYGSVGSLANSLEQVSRGLGSDFDLSLIPTEESGEDILRTIRRTLDDRGIRYLQFDRQQGFKSGNTSHLLNGHTLARVLRQTLRLAGFQLRAQLRSAPTVIGNDDIFALPEADLVLPSQNAFYLAVLARDFHQALCHCRRTTQDVARHCEVSHMHYVYKSFTDTAHFLDCLELELGYCFNIKLASVKHGLSLVEALNHAVAARGLSQIVLAERLNVLPATISNILKGKRLLRNVLAAFESTGYHLEASYLPVQNLKHPATAEVGKVLLHKRAKRVSTAVFELLRNSPQPQGKFNEHTLEALISQAKGFAQNSNV